MRLSDYYTAHLNEAERLIVESHIAECPSCRQAVEMMKLLAGDPGAEWQAGDIGHPSAELLSAFYNNPDDFDGKTRSSFEEHLTSCHRCRGDLDFMIHLESEMRESFGESKGTANLSLSFSDFMNSLIRKPVRSFAAAAALAFIVLGVTWVDRFYHQSPAFVFSNAGVVCRLAELHRSGGEPPVVARPAGDSVVFFEIPFYTRDDARYRFSVILEGDDEPAVDQLPADLGEKGMIRLQLDPGLVGDGRYYIQLQEITFAPAADTTRKMYPYILRSPAIDR